MQISVTRTPYIMTFRPESVRQFAAIVKDHWAIEEGHNCLDDLFDEDHSTTRKGNAPETCAFLRKIAYNTISLLEAKSKVNASSSVDHARRLTETKGKLVQGGIAKIKRLISHRFRSPFFPKKA